MRIIRKKKNPYSSGKNKLQPHLQLDERVIQEITYAVAQHEVRFPAALYLQVETEADALNFLAELDE